MPPSIKVPITARSCHGLSVASVIPPPPLNLTGRGGSRPARHKPHMKSLRSRPPRHLAVSGLFAAGLLSTGLLLGACGESSRDEAEASAPKRRESPRVRTEPVEQREMRRVLVTATAIESTMEVDVTAKVGGLVLQVLTEEGMAVTKDQVLVILDDREASAAVEEAMIALRESNEALPGLSLAVSEKEEAVQRAILTHKQAQGEVKRHEQTRLISENELSKLRLGRDQAERDLVSTRLSKQSAELNRNTGGTAVEKARLNLDRKKLELSFTRITAPFDGVIAQRTVRVGRNVGAAESLMVLTDPEHLRAVIYRPQRELSLFQGRADQLEITAHPDALPNEVFQGHLVIVSPTIDATSGSIRLSIDLDQPDVSAASPRLLPGMLVRLHIVVDQHPNALVVRKRALRREGERRYLFVVREGVAQRVDLEEGFDQDLWVEVLPLGDSTLAPGEAVITVGNRELESGVKVRVEQANPRGSNDPKANGGEED